MFFQNYFLGCYLVCFFTSILDAITGSLTKIRKADTTSRWKTYSIQGTVVIAARFLRRLWQHTAHKCLGAPLN